MKRAVVLVVAAGCGSPEHRVSDPAGSSIAPLSLAADARMVTIPDGQFIAGSTPEEREQAYQDYARAAGHDTAREKNWFEREEDRRPVQLPGFRIDLMPVTQAEYGEFVATGTVHPPAIDASAWAAQGFAQDYATQVQRFVWTEGRPPVGREDHPVVLVMWDEAKRYCEWRGQQAGEARRLPTALEFEKAARGADGIAYPWGNLYEPAKLNSVTAGPGDTVAVGSYIDGASPYGVLDMAGNVFQWTSTPWDADEITVKGSAWEDFPGLGRGAAGHGRAPTARHVIIGFRCAADLPAS